MSISESTTKIFSSAFRGIQTPVANSFHSTIKELSKEDPQFLYQKYQTVQDIPTLDLYNDKKINLDQFHQNLQRKFDDHTSRQLSFPIRHHNFEKMAPYLRHYLNNHGDSFQADIDYNSLRTRQFEQQVIHYFAQLYRSPNPKQVWGYMPSGSTESNLQGIYFAREYFKNYKHVPVLYSSKAHSSLNKSIYYLRMNSFNQIAKTLDLKIPRELLESGMIDWPERLPVLEDGQVNVEQFQLMLKPFAEHQIPIVISLTAGTTSGSAFDNTRKVIQALHSYEFYTDNRNHWIHIDGAWCGPYARFLEMAAENQNLGLPRDAIKNAQFDFSFEEVKSITTSIHKWIPSPFPSSVLLIRDKTLMPSDHLQEIYIRGQDYTLTTSRSGHAPLFTWDYLMSKTLNEHIEEAVYSYQLAKYLKHQLQEIEVKLGIDLKIQLSEIGLNIRFKKPSDEICYKYALMVLGEEAVVFIMPDKTKELCDMFQRDIFDDQLFKQSQLEKVL
ncbi:histidine decarboxylase [Stylonychia lemnae]|uniref:Histidine decarboxylase n=1 Tax=Stylonychia lemnae TaxID=5949 RepID=A0A078ABV5_STYLE|nr:histidine decarboxylase [Stylonychia lemnae]|eukprot:CDW79072.1 histidine decarboxylase [Stylonychia lemnae]